MDFKIPNTCTCEVDVTELDFLYPRELSLVGNEEWKFVLPRQLNGCKFVTILTAN